MASNPFFIQPVDLSSGLQGLGSMLAAKQKMDLAKEEAAKKEQRFAEWQTAAANAKTPEDFARLAAMFPENANAANLMLESYSSSLGLKRDQLNTLYKRALFSGDPKGVFTDHLAENPGSVEVQRFMEDLGESVSSPEQTKAKIEQWWGMSDPEGYKSWKDTQPKAPTGKDRYIVAGKSIYDTATNSWVGGRSPEAEGMDTTDLRGLTKDIQAMHKDTRDVIANYQQLEALRGRNTPAAQMAAVFAFMKSLDPTSVVRETEQGQVYEASGLAQGLANKFNKALGEGGLDEATFDDLVATAKALAEQKASGSKQATSDVLDVFGDKISPTQRKELLELSPVFESPETTTDASGGNLTVGQIYRDASGARARYLGGGKWEEIK